MNTDQDIALACRAIEDVWYGDPSLLTPDTAPSAIRTAQLDAVRAAHRELGTLDTAALSAHCDLPPWNIARALAQLKLATAARRPTVAAHRRNGEARVARVTKFLARLGRYATLGEIAAGTKLSRPHVRQCLSWGGNPFRRVRLPRPVSNGARFYWAYQNRGFKAAAVPA